MNILDVPSRGLSDINQWFTSYVSLMKLPAEAIHQGGEDPSGLGGSWVRLTKLHGAAGKGNAGEI